MYCTRSRVMRCISIVQTHTHIHTPTDGPDTDNVLEQDTTTGCILNNGRSYRGSVQTTEDDHPCQKWIYQFPQRHQFTDMMGGELDTASKYCRNPGGLGERPWCFIADWNIKRRWGYCDIPACGERHCNY